MRLCQIGCGEHARVAHGPAQARYASTHPGIELAACCDLDLGRASSYARDFGFARHHTDALAMLETERPDAVVLVVPDGLTCDLGCSVLERGLPLLLEKPPGRTVAVVDRLIAAAEGRRPSFPHRVPFTRRFVPGVAERRGQPATAPPIQHVNYDM